MSSISSPDPTPSWGAARSVAQTLQPDQREALAVQALAKTDSVSEIARRNEVSRKFVYQQKEKAEHAIAEAFHPEQADDSKVLFYLPVTSQWLHQLALALILICHSSYRGVIELFRDLLDVPISLGTVHALVQQAVTAARQVNEVEDLSPIKVGAHDEIFQARSPVLVGADVASTYCYLLSQEQARDGDTWGIRLLELSDKGMDLDYTIADGGKGLRAGQAQAWEDTPCHGDVFHPLLDMGRLSFYLENRAYGAMSKLEKLTRKMERAKKKAQGNKLSSQLAAARKAEQQSVELADDILALCTWMREDILAPVGPDFAARCELFDFVTDALRAREHLAPHRIKPVRSALEHQRDQLLAFVRIIDQELIDIAHQFHLPSATVRQVYSLHRPDLQEPQRHAQTHCLRQQLGTLFQSIDQAVADIVAHTVRASSIIENLNSRLRNYFFLRRQIGPQYLDLLRFFLNHRRFMRSQHAERRDKTPAELLAGHDLPHWLELLGFQLFKRVALA